MITYVKDQATGRNYGVIATTSGDGLVLCDVETPGSAPVLIRWSEIFRETRFTEVASTSDLN